MIDFDDEFDLIFQELTSQNLIDFAENSEFDFNFLPPIENKENAELILNLRPIDFPSSKEHYGLLSFQEWKIPIIYRLTQNEFYTPYIAFPFVLNIFGHSSYRNSFVNVRNLPLLEMTEVEREFYQKLISIPIDSEWSTSKVLSVSMLDCLLAMIDLARTGEQTTNFEENIREIRRISNEKWLLPEQTVNERLKRRAENNSTCFEQRTIGGRRSFFEQRLETSICDQSGGFIQIDNLIYPFVKHQNLYLNIDEIVKNLRLFSFYREAALKPDDLSIIKRRYNTLIDQIESNRIQTNRFHPLNKVFLRAQQIDENSTENLRFISVSTFVNWFQVRPFVQIFDNCSAEEIESSYKDSLGRQFILSSIQSGAIIDGTIPCFVDSTKRIWIPTERRTNRRMTNDERLLFNMIFIYRGLWKSIFSKTKQVYLNEVTQERENLRIEFLFQQQK